MRDTKKMVLLSWEKWEMMKSKASVKNAVEVEKYSKGVQTDISTKDFCHSFQGSEFPEKKILGDDGRGRLREYVSDVSLPSPPADFVKAYFEYGNKDTEKLKRKKLKKSCSDGKCLLNKKEGQKAKQFVVSSEGKWLTLK